MNAVIFDWDGTLFDSITHVMNVYRALFRILGIDDVDRRSFRNEFTADYHKYYEKKGIPREAFNYVDELWLCIYHQKESEMKLLPGVKETLRKLKKKGIGIGLVSDGTGARIRTELKSYSLGKYFDVIVTADETPEFKPSPNGILYALRELGVEPRKALYVGDLAEDIMAGKRAGTLTAGVLTGIHTRKRLLKAKPDFLLKDANEVLKIV